MQAETIIAIIELGLKVGVPAVTEAIREIGKDEVTDEDIQELIDGIIPPDEYFK